MAKLNNKNLLILGGDGYLGWSSALFFSKRGYNVTVVDNYFRRDVSKKNKSIASLYKLPNLIDRVKLWFKLTGKEIKVVEGDLVNFNFTKSLFQKNCKFSWKKSNEYNLPATVIHFAEQPSAPFSMMDPNNSNFTLVNNIISTNNLANAINQHSPKTHIIKLGTMGEYGTPNINIEEGWLDIKYKGRRQKFLYPRQASSLYHTSKIMDTDLLWFHVRNSNLRVTDLMQGPVYGMFTDEIKIHPNLKTIFNYDEIFGTVINRFIVQAVCNYPLTIYGKGNQTRGYINLVDSLKCIEISLKNKPKPGELRIFNQISETLTVNQIAKKIIKTCKKYNINAKKENLINPRIEKENHYYNPKYQALKKLGFNPTLFDEKIIHEMLMEVFKFKSKIKKNVIFKGIRW